MPPIPGIWKKNPTNRKNNLSGYDKRTLFVYNANANNPTSVGSEERFINNIISSGQYYKGTNILPVNYLKPDISNRTFKITALFYKPDYSGNCNNIIIQYAQPSYGWNNIATQNFVTEGSDVYYELNCLISYSVENDSEKSPPQTNYFNCNGGFIFTLSGATKSPLYTTLIGTTQISDMNESFTLDILNNTGNGINIKSLTIEELG
jgi:hypothetical protein